ncbi:hypothetical protein F66182_1479 [Fusarium sp. NRRL 66182]|nr:hypothetical protein F66182_1479 [Fusarium sp. NRRL 66182]
MAGRTYSTIRTSGEGGEFDIAPLTTIWTVGEGCASVVTFANLASIDASCYPPDYERVWYDGGYYSPGICPSGYTSGCRPSSGDGEPVKTTETAVICVPSGYQCSDGLILHASSMSGGNTISVPAFQIRWAESDLPALETHPLSQDEADISTASVTDDLPISAATETNPLPSQSSSSGLPTGAVVGIAVGSAAVVAIVGIVVFCLFRRRYRAAKTDRNNQDSAAQGQPITFSGTPELGGQPLAVEKPNGAATIPAQRIYELEKNEKSPAPIGYPQPAVVHPHMATHGHVFSTELADNSRTAGEGTAKYEMSANEVHVAEMEGAVGLAVTL